MRINLHHLALITALLCLPWTISVRAADQAGFPLEISHALGNTTIATRPNRVATIAWANHEVPLALGIVPVGMAAANFGDDDGDGLLPWVAERLKELDAQAPQLFDEGDGIDFEAVAGTRPDVILAAYSGLSQSDYDTLSQIAPVIAYPQAPWSTDWREMIRFDSAGLGLAKEGDMLIADIERKIAMEVAKYPELRGKTAMFVTHLDASDLSIVNFYTTQDTRVRFFGDLGLSPPKSVVQASSTGSFAGSISAEQIDLFDDVDILVTYGDRGLIEAMKANPLLAHMPAVKHDAIVMLGRDPVGTAANPTPLSITWVLPAYVAMLAEAARKTE
ncbi:iron-siderophore ABC transporter substrate-binding protein [Rhizobium sp. 'Codium 1']|uniref:iron-siderophore ABC transporter substrate-binding protein n=1 Tax=Rhizobium sp. 'Codium 1' TaxID=2940484 RepID=UPI001E2EFE9B|nr:iron-siderophore ABC transporter substrate-binding protein [Rhizobium sp. 'Codium 1']MCC8932779.1 iron-siderophore ABC transporter substrate-binding protein [Rhizobium sp. 'Codium 1']